MVWLLLALAIAAELAGTICMKLSQGFTRLVPSLLIFVFYGVSFAALTGVLTRIEVGVAYAIWAGAGTALIAAIGIVWFGESLGAVKLISIALIVIGVVALNLSSPGR
jgi:small multidrug resistance pump